MDFEKELQGLNEKELKMVLCVIRFLKWLDTGGTKTKEIARGERLYSVLKSPVVDASH